MMRMKPCKELCSFQLRNALINRHPKLPNSLLRPYKQPLSSLYAASYDIHPGGCNPGTSTTLIMLS
jgi:hypothetical protein